MSKSQVNNFQQFRISKMKSDGDVKLSPLQALIEKGRQINYDRSHKESEIFEFAKFTSNGVKQRGKDSYFCKIIYPREGVYPKCDHVNHFRANRKKFTRDEYLAFLSEPKKHFQKPQPKVIRKPLPIYTARINTLSQPKRSKLISTLLAHMHHFTYDRVETLLKKICMGENQTPEKTLETMHMKVEDHKRKIRTQKQEIRKLKRKINKNKSLNELQLSKFKDLKLNDLIEENGEVPENIESLILTRLCQFTNYKVPDMYSENQMDEAYINLAKRFARQIRFKSKSHEESECKKRIQNDCYPIQSYFPELLQKAFVSKSSSLSISSPNKLATSSEDSISEQENELNEDAKVIVFDSETRLKLQQECKEINERLEKEKALNEIKKKNLAEKRSANAAQREASKKLDKKSSKSSTKKKSTKKGANGESSEDEDDDHDENDDVNDNDEGNSDESDDDGNEEELKDRSNKNKNKRTKKNKKDDKHKERKQMGGMEITADQKWEVEWKQSKSLHIIE